MKSHLPRSKTRKTRIAVLSQFYEHSGPDLARRRQIEGRIDDPIEGMEPAVKDDLRATFGRKKGMWMLPAKTKEAPVHLLNPWGKTFEDHHLIRLGILCSTEDGVGDGFIIIDDFDWKIVITKNGTVTFSTDKWIEDYKQM